MDYCDQYRHWWTKLDQTVDNKRTIGLFKLKTETQREVITRMCCAFLENSKFGTEKEQGENLPKRFSNEILADRGQHLPAGTGRAVWVTHLPPLVPGCPLCPALVDEKGLSNPNFSILYINSSNPTIHVSRVNPDP